MKAKLFVSVSIAIGLLGGCAGTGGSKSNTKAAASTQVAKAPTAKDVIDRYRKAIYGGDGTRKHPATTMKGTLMIEQFNIEGPFVSYSAAPDSNVSNIEVMGMKLSNGCHKGVCWAQQPGAGTTILTGDAAALQLQQADYNQWQHLERYYTSLELVEPTDGKDTSTNKIKAVKKNGETDYFYFSKETGLMTAGVIEGETPQGRMQISMQFNNYKSFDGMMIPTELVQSTQQATIKLRFTDVSFAPISEDKFAKPN